MNPDDLNLYYEAVWNEATALTGFNFEYESLVVGTDIEDGAIIRVRTTSTEVDHGIDVATNDGAPTVCDPTPAITGLIRSRSDFEWRTIVTETVTVSTCNLWVIFSWQQGVTDPTPSTFKGGCQYVLAIDGVPIMETMTGSGEKHGCQWRGVRWNGGERGYGDRRRDPLARGYAHRIGALASDTRPRL
jgi:hypothetical protein